jgi:hypothetical protein
MVKVIDKKTGRQLHSGDVLLRKDYKGFTRRYEMISISEDNTRIQVREVGRDDRWLYHTFPLSRLGLDVVMV